MNNWLWLILLTGSYSVGAQSSIQYQLDSVEISALRIPAPRGKSSFAVSAVDLSRVPPVSGMSLNDHLISVPGLFASNASNYAQDLRISVRGFGSRASFGIRGIKLVVDGIEETTPDGQGQVDNLDLLNVERIEVVRSPSSALYGNAAGGVIFIDSQPSIRGDFFESAISAGSYGMRQLSFKGGLKTANTSHFIRASHIRSEGYRFYSRMNSTSVGYSAAFELPSEAELLFQISYTDSPEAQDPGGLTAENIAEGRMNARDQNVTFDAGESISQAKVSVQFNSRPVQSRAYVSSRTFTGRLPFTFGGWIELDRMYGGHSTSWSADQTGTDWINKIQLGYDLAFQSDGRKRFENNRGIRGDKTVDQTERFRQYGIYVLDRLILNRWEVSGGLRLDFNQLRNTDQFLGDGDDSGSQTYWSLNPRLGINFQIADRNFLFGNWSTSFETPALSELSANPTGAAGFNEDLTPQRSVNFEMGYRISRPSVSGEIVLFHTTTTDEILAFELPDFPDRDFYRNAGSTKRSGVEFQMDYRPITIVEIQLSYTAAKFRFEDFVLDGTDFKDKDLPGIPQQQASLSVFFNTENGWKAGVRSRLVGRIAVDNQNSVYDDSYILMNTSVQRSFKLAQVTITPFFGIDNLLNVLYNDNIRINAFGGRFYEPGQERGFYGGARVKF